MKRLICWLIGHETDLMDPYNTRCFRCGHEWDYGDRVRDDLMFFLLLSDVRSRCLLHRLRWWLKCPDCGRRFGRHKENCMPF